MKDYGFIDNHALHAPPSVSCEVKDLAAYLVKPARDDTDKARAIFRWIAENIEYDTAKYFRKSGFGRENAESALRSRKGVCAAFSNLFQALARQAGMEAVTISGHGKGYSYKPGDAVTGNNHDWNAVKLNSRWHLLDATWGAGYIDDCKTYNKCFDDFFFLTPPRYFIFTHLPEDSRWQLLEQPLTKDTYEGIIKVKSRFFTYGIKPLSHTRSVISTGGTLAVILEAKQTLMFSTALPGGGAIMKMPLSFVQKEKGKYIIRCVFPAKGEYVLKIFAKKPEEKNDYHLVMEYLINAGSGTAGKIGFPQSYLHFDNTVARLYEPLCGFLKRGTHQHFKLYIPGALEAAVVINGQWNRLQKKGDYFEGTVFITHGKPAVFALFKTGNTYQGLLQYDVC
jgi:hypothetical protein